MTPNSVFSKQLVERWRLLYMATHRKNPPNNRTPEIKDLIHFFKKYNISLATPVMTCHVISTLSHVAEPAIYKLCTNEELRRTAKWINDNLVLTMVEDDYRTQGVKIRIAVSMLNRLCDKGVITREENIFFFDNVVSNVKDCKHDVMNEDLPF